MDRILDGLDWVADRFEAAAGYFRDLVHWWSDHTHLLAAFVFGLSIAVGVHAISGLWL